MTKVHDEYIIDPNEFVSPFKVGEAVIFENEAVNIIRIAGPTLTIQPILWWSRFREIWTGTVGWTVMDWEVEKRLHWLRRVGRTAAKWWGETATATDKEAKKEDYAHELYKMIDDNYCDHCHGHTDFLPKPRNGSCLSTKCKHCGQRYWFNFVTRTAGQI